MARAVRTVLVYHETSVENYAAELIRRAPDLKVITASNREEAQALQAQADCLFAWRYPFDLLVNVAADEPLPVFVQLMGAGVEDAARSGVLKRVPVARIVEQFGAPMAEYVFLYLLAEIKRYDAFRDAQERHAWEQKRTGSLRGMTLGVAGLGSIGAEIARMARAFSMRVHGLSLRQLPVVGLDSQYGADDWQAFVASCDAVVLALPLTPQTERVVDARVLAAMKPESILINVGRGHLVDEEALLIALQEKRLRRAILDVFTVEPLPSDHPFWTHPRVTVTPHVSGPSLTEEVVGAFLENVARYRAGEPLAGLVDAALGY